MTTDALPQEVYIGIMTGTSLDAIDLAACAFDAPTTSDTTSAGQVKLLGVHTTPWSAALRALLMEFASQDVVSLDELTRANMAIAREYAEATHAMIAKLGLTHVRAIGMHGQTIRHLPQPDVLRGLDRPIAGTLQLGSGSALAALTGIDVVSDFRSADVALGGQGAPLVPIFDAAFLSSERSDRLLVNIGGISNLTYLPKRTGTATDHAVVAFDCGPGNMMLDLIMQEFADRPYDASGAVARGGQVHRALLEEMLAHRYFQTPPPRSTGRELFGSAFLRRARTMLKEGSLPLADAMATLTELTAHAIANSLSFIGPTTDLEVIVSGGGAHNTFLMERLGVLLRQEATAAGGSGAVTLTTSDALGIPAGAKEAVAFAFLAKACLDRLPVHLPSTTGASRQLVLGSISIGASPSA